MRVSLELAPSPHCGVYTSKSTGANTARGAPPHRPAALRIRSSRDAPSSAASTPRSSALKQAAVSGNVALEKPNAAVAPARRPQLAVVHATHANTVDVAGSSTQASPV